MAKKAKETITEEKVKKVEKISTPITKDVEVDITEEKLKFENEKLELEKQRIELEKQRMEMQLEMEKFKLFISNSQNKEQTNTIVEDNEIELSCNMVYGISLESQNKDVQIDLKYRTQSVILESDFKKLLRKVSVRKLFEEGIVYFVDKSNYRKFAINNYNDISDEVIKEILKENISVITEKFNEFTQNKKNINALHSLLYRICKMIKDNEISDLSYSTRKSLEVDYFRIEFDKGISYLTALEKK